MNPGNREGEQNGQNYTSPPPQILPPQPSMQPHPVRKSSPSNSHRGLQRTQRISRGEQKLKLDKAIEILQLNLNTANVNMPHDCRDAIKLGIEALKRCQEIKNYTPKDTYCPLPGEDSP